MSEVYMLSKNKNRSSKPPLWFLSLIFVFIFQGGCQQNSAPNSGRGRSASKLSGFEAKGEQGAANTTGGATNPTGGVPNSPTGANNSNPSGANNSNPSAVGNVVPS